MRHWCGKDFDMCRIHGCRGGELKALASLLKLSQFLKTMPPSVGIQKAG